MLLSVALTYAVSYGWVSAADGATVEFSMIANDLPSEAAGNALQDRVVTALASYPKAPSPDEIAPEPTRLDLARLTPWLTIAARHNARVLMTLGLKAQRHPEYYPPEMRLITVCKFL